MKAALAQFFRLCLDWLERDQDKRDLMTQIHDGFERTPTTKRFMRAEERRAGSRDSRTASKLRVMR